MWSIDIPKPRNNVHEFPSNSSDSFDRIRPTNSLCQFFNPKNSVSIFFSLNSLTFQKLRLIYLCIRLAIDTSDLFQPTILSAMLCDILLMSGSMLLLQTELVSWFSVCLNLLESFEIDAFVLFLLQFQSRDESNSLIIAASVVQLCLVIGTAFNICEVGQRWSDSFNQIFDMINQFDWYLCPIEIQRILPTLIIVGQQSVDLIMTGSTSANRTTFKRVNPSLVNFIWSFAGNLRFWLKFEFIFLRIDASCCLFVFYGTSSIHQVMIHYG